LGKCSNFDVPTLLDKPAGIPFRVRGRARVMIRVRVYGLGFEV
jgi:hypothetical protein